MDSFNSLQDRRNSSTMSPQIAQQNVNLVGLGQPRSQNTTSLYPNWSGAGDDPWTPLSYDSSSTRSQIFGSANFQTSYQEYQNYRSKPLLSECDTNPDDSAYGSRLTHSIGNPSAYGEDLDPDIQTLESQNVDTQLVNSDLESLQLQCQSATNDSQQYPDQWTRPRPPASVATAPVGGERRWSCRDCEKTCRTRSELRKHELKHSLPWRCNVTGCSRNKGFTSKNDLDRHKRTVHNDRTVSGRAFVCNIGSCAKKTKVWPRADNFRSHLERMHHKSYSANDDLTEYVYRPVPSQGLEGVGGSAMAYLQAQEQSPGLVHPSAILSFRGHGGDRRASQPQPSISGLSRGPAPILIDRVISGLAPVRESDESFIRPDMISGPGPIPQDRWSRSPTSGEDAPGDDITTSESGQHDDATPDDMDGVQESGTLETEASSDNSSSQQPDIGMVDVDEAQQTPRAVILPDQSSLDSSNINSDLTYEILDKIPKEVIASYMKKHSTEIRDETPKSDVLSGKSQGHSYKCQDCDKPFPRLCELKKHQKRHSKPYGCTFINCNKTFGSKNDWKRHESIQHYQLERWVCDCSKASIGGPCGKVCHRRESFRNHLTKEHQVSDPRELEEKVDTCRIGRHCDAHFWCGFCRETIKIKEMDNTWTKRCDHIDGHFSGRDVPQRHISEWVHEKDLGAGTTAPLGAASESSSISFVPDPKPTQAVASQGISSEDRRDWKDTYMWTCLRPQQGVL
ncbi:hypothetical protein FLAG1_04974 [Fusarium langsethiae]|uniref:C2H2-type domain-containing protein n=1 Tax=Fusarium langsethiae TaxID=179993 RepID=A0A0M9EXX4_FUSLA|nr:hypothetical protein FLAG1_04974 [Fusarium langsethiae]GKT99818.1 unnamed protein product [Fusarium langsethiae]GKU20347.1 unnamed protein product [Fusarium langsethiae]